jgi:16S rRNA (guanine527-N7)-methyltransferase
MAMDPEQHAKLERFLREIQSWGDRINLVGSTARTELEVHVRDALAAGPHLQEASTLVDLGSGAGFPGVPLAIARPGVRVTLVEAREKKAHFLRHVVRLLDLAVEVRCERFERGAPGCFDVVCMRGVGPAGRTLPAAAPWARPAGELWLWTRLAAHAAGVPVAAVLELGERGRILRIRADAFPRGTLRRSREGSPRREPPRT